MRTAMVTGAARGLGSAYSRGLAKKGFKVALVDIEDATETERSIGEQSKAFKVDMTSEDDVKRGVDEIEKSLGPIDVLVNNVGAFPEKPFLETDLDFFHKILKINLDTAFIGSRVVAPRMISRNYGRIINIATGVVFKGNKNFVAYGAAKGGVVAMTKVLATELGAYNITVNCVSPGLTDTPGARTYHPDLYHEEANIATRAIKRRETPEDVVGTICFLASDEASFITGQTIAVDGGSVRLG